MTDPVFSPEDERQIADRGQDLEAIRGQLARFARGMRFVRLERPCRVGDGIRRLSAEDLARSARLSEAAMAAGRGLKFVPASGAGTRMFRDFLRGLHEGVDAALAAELERIDHYPFYPALEQAMRQAGLSLDTARRDKDYALILGQLLGPQGLNYGEIPKGLIPFHRYADRCRTPFEEHLVEAAETIRSAQGLACLHFTVAKEQEAAVREFFAAVQPSYETGGLRFETTFSVQKKSSDTIAVDPEGRPFRDRAGQLLFRPAGHGALLDNLDATGGDLVFVKNVDNVAPDSRKEDTVLYKKAMAGVLVEIQETCFRYLRRLEAGSLSPAELAEIEAFVSGTLSASLPPDWPERGAAGRERHLFERLHRPLRVCGMVPNQGEPGGAPFWVEEPEGGFSLQIVEAVQVDPGDLGQQRVFRSSTHFNPVDLVCGLRDFRGGSFPLADFSDPEAGFISQKSYEGRALLALELPGLWNGGMARWNTVFVELPLSTFSPVKQVQDLLRPEHR